MSLVGLRYSSEFPVPPGTPTFLQRLPEETRPHKPAAQFSGLAELSGGDAGRKIRVAATGSEGTLSPRKLTCRQMENKMTE